MWYTVGLLFEAGLDAIDESSGLAKPSGGRRPW
jgi:hypothetical protein